MIMAEPRTAFAPVTAGLVEQLSDIVGVAHITVDPDALATYSHDWTEDLRFPPEVVVRPRTSHEVAAILRLCNELNVPVTPAGGRTGLSGGMLPIYGGVLLSLERMNRIVELDTRNLQITVEPGVITQHLQDAAEAVGLYYPPDPSSRGSCFIGGNLAHNAGGLHAVKYGITNAYVLALEVALPSGELIHTGARVLKNSTGYNLTQLMVGSEGTLGVITQSTHKLIPLPQHRRLMLAPYASAEAAIETVSKFFQAGLTPAALEFVERDAIVFGQQYLGINRYSVDGVAAHLMVEFDGNDPSSIMTDCERAVELMEASGAGDILFAESADEQRELWRLRRCLGEAVKGTTIYKEEDTVVPRAELPKLLAFVKKLGAEFPFQSVCYGHAGDGNLHVNILKGDMPLDRWEHELPLAIRHIFDYTVSLGGTLSGEHGIGFVQRRYLEAKFSPIELELMRGIKRLFDPKGILNPGKLVG